MMWLRRRSSLAGAAAVARDEERAKGRAALAGTAYADAFAAEELPKSFITYHAPEGSGSATPKALRAEVLSRGDVLCRAYRAACLLRRRGVASPGDTHAHYFSGNTVEDVVLRLAAVMLRSAPVTINWQADTVQRVVRKVQLSRARVLIVDEDVPPEAVDAVRAAAPGVAVVTRAEVAEAEADEGGLGALAMTPAADATRMIIFTSGTTGDPKGVALTYGNYACNEVTFEAFLQMEGAPLTLVVTNPLHHTNSTAMLDWALRRCGTAVHLLKAYTTNYWALLAAAANDGGAADPRRRLVAPLVSRHFDFLDSLIGEGRLPVDPSAFIAAVSAPHVTLLLGSAPVGPTTVERLVKHCGRLPCVRFGSTETCLQVAGTPLGRSDAETLRAFERGWDHRWQGEPQGGYYIGRPHPPHTEVAVVKSVNPEDAEAYLQPAAEGEPGRLITRGANVMGGYLHNDEATRKAVDSTGGWYLNLGDVCFYLKSKEDGGRDFYWLARDSALLIKGGANYAYEQINTELARVLSVEYGLGATDATVAVVGLRVASEHEDECCAAVELRSQAAKEKEEDLVKTFLLTCKRKASKGARPDRAVFLLDEGIPRNFKGAVVVHELISKWKDQWLESSAQLGGDTRRGLVSR